MRKFIVKYFALSSRVKVLGKTYNMLRASKIIYPLFVIAGFFTAINKHFPHPSLFIWFLYGILLLSLFFGFAYFIPFPVKYSELDEYQKYKFGQKNYEKLSRSEFIEWQQICRKYDKDLLEK